MHYVHAAELPINSIKFNRFHLNYSSNSSNSKNQLKNKPRKHGRRTESAEGGAGEWFVGNARFDHHNEASNERHNLAASENRRNEYGDRQRRPSEQIPARQRRRRRRQGTDFKQSNKKLNKFANNRQSTDDDWSDQQAASLVSGDELNEQSDGGDRSSSPAEIDNVQPKQRRRTSANKRNRSLLANLVSQYTALMQSQLLLPALFMSYNGSQLLPDGRPAQPTAGSTASPSRRPLTSSSSAGHPLGVWAPADLPDPSPSVARDLIDSFHSHPPVAFLFASNQSYDTSFQTFNSSYDPSLFSYSSVLSPGQQRDWLVNRSEIYPDGHSYGQPDVYLNQTSPAGTLNSSTTSTFTSVPFFDMLNLNLILTILISVMMVIFILLTAVGNLFVIAAILRDRVLVSLCSRLVLVGSCAFLGANH